MASAGTKRKHEETKASDGNDKETYTLFFTAADPFSQWYMRDFTVDGIKYNCAEQYMMHQKAVLFGDAEHAELILEATEPRDQKKLGRQVKNFDEKIWGENCKKIVHAGNVAKFSQNDDLKEIMFATKGTILVEAAPRDRIWGIGLGKDNPKALDKRNWRGKNLLGYILTDVREELMNKS